jgi:hypothetical protein
MHSSGSLKDSHEVWTQQLHIRVISEARRYNLRKSHGWKVEEGTGQQLPRAKGHPVHLHILQPNCILTGICVRVVLEFELRTSCLLDRLYHLSHASTSFCTGYFEIESHLSPRLTWTLTLPISVFQGARITGESHHA